MGYKAKSIGILFDIVCSLEGQMIFLELAGLFYQVIPQYYLIQILHTHTKEYSLLQKDLQEVKNFSVEPKKKNRALMIENEVLKMKE
ncbi:MAG: hypothetical protein R2751_04390 [Bacteroidales bacterium]